MLAVPVVRNRLLSLLTCEQQELLRPKLEHVMLKKGMVVSPGNREITAAYFLESGLSCATWSGLQQRPVDILLFGRDGLIGAPLILGVTTTPFQVMMLTSGSALRIKASDLIQLTTSDAEMRTVLLRYTAHLMLLLAQTATCNAAHPIQNRLPSLLLRCADQTGSSHVLLSHQALAHLLGVRRSSISDAIRRLECKGAVQTGHSHITIINDAILKVESCDCYRALQRQAKSVLGYSIAGDCDAESSGRFSSVMPLSAKKTVR